MTHQTTGLIALRPPIQTPKEPAQPTIAESMQRTAGLRRPPQNAAGQS